MDSITEYVDNLIEALRNDSLLRFFRFNKVFYVNAFDPAHNELIAIFNIAEVKRGHSFIARLYKRNTRGEIYKAKLIIRLYGGNTVSGESLASAAVLLKNEVFKADGGEFITDGKICPIEYESKTGAVYRELEFNIEYALCEAEL